MKQAIMTAPGKIQIQDITAPTPGPGEVLLRIQRIGVCGSDVHVYHGKHPYTKYPVVQGHEYSAAVEAVGPGVAGLAPGMKVTSMPQIVCGECAPCKRGDYHICDKLKVEGFQAPGCAQELWVTPAAKIVPLPDRFSFEQGALVEPVSVAATERTAVIVGAPTTCTRTESFSSPGTASEVAAETAAPVVIGPARAGAWSERESCACSCGASVDRTQVTVPVPGVQLHPGPVAES